jgi:hypothetical protein
VLFVPCTRHFPGSEAHRLDVVPASRLLCLPPAFTLISCSVYSALKKEAICFSETLVDFSRTTGRYIPEDSTLHNHRCENLKSFSYLMALKEMYRQWTLYLSLKSEWRWFINWNSSYLTSATADCRVKLRPKSVKRFWDMSVLKTAYKELR